MNIVKQFQLQVTVLNINNLYIVILLATVFKGDPKVSFSLATPWCMGGHDSFPRILHLFLDLYLIMLTVKQRGIKYNFYVFGMSQPGIEPRSSGPVGEHSTQ